MPCGGGGLDSLNARQFGGVGFSPIASTLKF